MDFLKRNLAPLTDRAWASLSREAETNLRTSLVARRVVDVEGPLGFSYSAVNVGKLGDIAELGDTSIRYGVRQLQPLMEMRTEFALPVWDLDDLSRGADDVDTGPLTEACRRLVAFEDGAVFRGFQPAGIRGICSVTDHDVATLPSNPNALPEAIARGMLKLESAGVGGPYALVLGSKAYQELAGQIAPYPPRKRIEELMEGPVVHSPSVDGGVLLSLRGGDFKLTVGLDPSLGYETHDASHVRLYLTETFTFRVLAPEAAVLLAAAPGG